MKNQNRIASLDWLRGLMALSIMFYHLIGWLFFSLDSGTILGRLGIYGVLIFFILSGLSMAIVYNKYIKDIKTSAYFLVRRIFRIWPLFWMACFLVIVMTKFTNSGHYSAKVIVLNLTTMFGFIKPEANIPLGSWSIGNEMVYYFITPFIIYIYNKKLFLGNLVFLVTVAIGILFSYFLLSPNTTLGNQWVTYINPLNSLYMYTAGIAIYYNFRDKKIQQSLNIIVLLLCVLLFVFVPFNGDQINIVTGNGRIIFTIISIALVFSVYKLEIALPKIIEYPLEKLGIATYSVYLLHPIVYWYTAVAFHRILKIDHPRFLFISIIAITITLSIISYKYLEKPFMDIGKRLTKSKTNLISNGVELNASLYNSGSRSKS